MDTTRNRQDAIAAHASPRHHSLLQWQGLMREAMTTLRSGRTAAAGHLYLQALAIAQTLLQGRPQDALDDEDCVAAFVVTHLNLADWHRDAEQAHAALGHICAAHRTLMAVLRDEHASPALQQAACRHSRETHAALIEHLANHGSHPDAVLALRAGCMPFPWRGATLH